ncbi:methyltransferase domain-containing protein [Microcystis elabens FACHB-917]|nr:methyltransferase domain-containing protein [Microcystis elabens FACHB-917]
MVLDTPNQLALHRARQVQINTYSKYIEEFLNNINPKLDCENASCPTCNFTADAPLFTKNSGTYCFCPSCQHIFLSNPLSEAQLLRFYADYPTSSLEWHQNESDFYRNIYIKGLALIGSTSQVRTVLDIGCSSGYFLSIAAEQGLDVFGIEPNRQEVNYAINNGINILGSTISDLGDLTFDAITLWDVLEHIRRPVGYLEMLRSHLNPNGLIFVQVPSCDSLAARIMREACNMFDGIEHLTLFSATSLDAAFSQAGLKCLSKQTVISDIYAIRNYLSYEVDPYLPQLDTQLAMDLLEPELIESSGLGYKIQAVYSVSQP